MRFTIKDRTIDMNNWLHHPDFCDKQVEELEIDGDQLYVHWEEVQ